MVDVRADVLRPPHNHLFMISQNILADLKGPKLKNKS